MDWVGLGLLVVFVVLVLKSWWQERRSDLPQDARFDRSGVDFSIYLYSSKRGQLPRLDR
ncbi:hypothetical protein HZU75_05035 [Chitinibacter fontanus]|uniref:Uncharacterized protein n=1 Tax=Chitinibacter fontanus TaxID=1737446 RepID=A0A7D5V8V8_9NEIS|nr:hypothetical protein [Chitinibacter fontanus]QLI80938.1 hypothetical protein HZU75_05035 [Chitinibacter fontanus]